MGRQKGGGILSLKSLNHVSLLCNCLEKSVHFYRNVLGFQTIQRPASLGRFDGAWLFNYGFGIHLLQREEHSYHPERREIEPSCNLICFQCQSLALMEKKLKETHISYVRRRVEEWGFKVNRLFFHDPDGNLIKICSFEDLPVIPSPAGERAVASTSLRAGQLPPQALMAEASAATTN